MPEKGRPTALARIINNPGLLATLKNGALSRANKFTHQQYVLEMVEQFYKLDIAEAVISGRNTARHGTRLY
jgi:hypothetical protein